MYTVLPCCKCHLLQTATAWGSCNLILHAWCCKLHFFCWQGRNLSVYQIFMFTYMIVFNATSQLWFCHMLIMYLIEFMQVTKSLNFHFRANHKSFLTTNPPTIWHILVHTLITKKKKEIIQEFNYLFFEWSGVEGTAYKTIQLESHTFSTVWS